MTSEEYQTALAELLQKVLDNEVPYTKYRELEQEYKRSLGQ